MSEYWDLSYNGNVYTAPVYTTATFQPLLVPQAGTPVAEPQKSALDWLDEQTESVCKVARAA